MNFAALAMALASELAPRACSVTLAKARGSRRTHFSKRLFAAILARVMESWSKTHVALAQAKAWSRNKSKCQFKWKGSQLMATKSSSKAKAIKLCSKARVAKMEI